MCIYTYIHTNNTIGLCEVTNALMWLCWRCFAEFIQEHCDHHVDQHLRVTWFIHTSGMTCLYMWHDSFTSMTRLIQIRDETPLYMYPTRWYCQTHLKAPQSPRWPRNLRVTWLIHICGVTPLHVWYDSLILPNPSNSFTSMTWLIYICDETPSYIWHNSLILLDPFNSTAITTLTNICMWHDTFTSVMWLIHVCDMTRSYMWHDPSACATWLMHTRDTTHSYKYLTGLILVDNMTHSYLWHDAFISVTWLVHIAKPITSKQHLYNIDQYRMTKIHRMPDPHRSFSAKEPYN